MVDLDGNRRSNSVGWVLVLVLGACSWYLVVGGSFWVSI